MRRSRPDGKFVAFLSDRDGPFDAWLGQVGSGEFLNLTKAGFPSIANPIVHNVGFAATAHICGSESARRTVRAHSVWLVPTIGGTPRPFLPDAVEAAWSPDRSRIAYYAPEPGDPIFIADPSGANARQLCKAKPGVHQHYVTWSPNGRFVYFVRGIPPDEMDIWRVASAGGSRGALKPSQLSRCISEPARRAHSDLHRHARGRLRFRPLRHGRGTAYRAPASAGLEEYVSVAADADGRRLAATVASPVRDLWTVPIMDRVVDESAVKPLQTPNSACGGASFRARLCPVSGVEGSSGRAVEA